MNRRDFIKTTVLTGASIIAQPLKVTANDKKPEIKSYRPLGKTGLKMSDISLGTGKAPYPSIILRALDRGINYIDTAPDYGDSEDKLGKALKRIKKRDQLIIATKFCRHGSYPKHLLLGSSKRDFIDMVEGSLKRLGTDYIDIVFVHAIGSVSRDKKEELDRLLNQEMLSAVDTLKRDGKIRFLGVSSHGPHHMEELMYEAIKSNQFEVVMLAFNFMKFPHLPDVIKEAHKKGIGVVAMKTLAGAKDMEINPGEDPFEVAALKWVLKHKEISGLVVTMKSIKEIDLYLRASGQPFTSKDQRVIDRYASLYGKEYCRTGCGNCEEGCKKGIPIATTLRYRMYYEDYGMEKNAILAYNQLPIKADQCQNCIEPLCESRCPYGLKVRNMLVSAHEMLTLTA